MPRQKDLWSRFPLKQMAAMWHSFDQRTAAEKAKGMHPLLSSLGDSGPCPTLQTEGGEEKQQIWLLGGIAEKLFTSWCSVIGVTDFYVVKVEFHCPVDSKKPYMPCSSLCCVLRGCPTSTVMLCTTVQERVHNHCQPHQQLGRLYVYILYSKANTLLTNPQKQ